MGDQLLDEKAIFNVACSIESADERQEYLRQVCGDAPQLCQRVSRLLQLKAESRSFMEVPAAGIAATIQLSAPVERPGTCIGPYKLRELLGEGGMGSVYVAEQEIPVRRKVALKIIKPGMYSRDVISRFEAERQALALMDHPNIAKMLDAGTMESGRPYFVMELVKGSSITEHCDALQLNTRERLHLFLQICQAVQHAHQKGIIHRDLKPSNVIVAMHDTAPVVKVIDFGVAKAIGQQLTEHTLYTGFCQMIGTPLYMSPEQAGQSSLDVDTRSDIYSLGVLLYELLSGTTPFELATFKSAGFDEMRRIIREVDPPRPSARLSTLHDAALSTIAHCHRIETRRQLSHQLRGELDWIVMKAIEKDRTRRYETANGLAADVERYLRDERVVACPPSAVYLYGKFVRHHKRLLTTTALVALALVAGICVATWQAIEAHTQRAHAQQQSERAETNLRTAMDAVNKLLTRVGDEKLRDVPQMEELRREILDDARQFYEDFLKENSQDPSVQLETARILLRLEQMQADLGHAVDGTAAWLRALKMLGTLHQLEPDNLIYIVELAEANTRFAWRSSETNKEQRLRNAIALLEPLSALSPDDPKLEGSNVACLLANNYNALGSLLGNQGQPDEAEQMIQLAISLYEGGSGWAADVLATSYHNLGDLRQTQGRLEEARGTLQTAIEIRRRVVKELSQNAFYRRELAEDLATLADISQLASLPNEAVEAYTEALTLIQQLVVDFPLNTNYRYVERSLLTRAIQSLRDAGQAPKAYDFVQRFHPRTSADFLTRAIFYADLKRPDEGIADCEQALAIDPDNEPIHRQVLLLFGGSSWDTARAQVVADTLLGRWPEQDATAWIVAGKIDLSAGNLPRAMERLHRGIELSPRHGYAMACLGNAYASLGEMEQAQEWLQKAGNADPDDSSQWWREIGDLHAKLGDYQLALHDYQQAIERKPDDWNLYRCRADAELQLGQFSEALADLDRALELRPMEWHLYKRRAQAAFELGRFSESLADLNRALELRPDDSSTVTWIAPRLVAACPDTAFRAGILELADRGVELNKSSSEHRMRRVTLLATMRQFDRVKQDLEQLAAEGFTAHYVAYLQALLELKLGNESAYRTVCREMLDRFRDSESPDELHFAVWTCTLAPAALDDYAAAEELARRSLKADPDNKRSLQALGAVLYRAGKFAAALETLTTSDSAPENEGRSAVYSRYFLALTCHCLGQGETARHWLEMARNDAMRSSAEENPWNRQLTLDLLDREAAELLNASKASGVDPPSTTPPAPADSPQP